MIRFFCFLLILRIAETAITCGKNTLPYSIEITREKEVELKCSKPKCLKSIIHNSYSRFGTNKTLNFYATNFKLCNADFVSDNCGGTGSWIAGINSATDTSKYLNVTCCYNDALKSTKFVKSIFIQMGQKVKGGDIKENDKLIGFNYISNVVKVINYDKSVTFKVSVHQLLCKPPRIHASKTLSIDSLQLPPLTALNSTSNTTAEETFPSIDFGTCKKNDLNVDEKESKDEPFPEEPESLIDKRLHHSQQRMQFRPFLRKFYQAPILQLPRGVPLRNANKKGGGISMKRKLTSDIFPSSREVQAIPRQRDEESVPKEVQPLPRQSDEDFSNLPPPRDDEDDAEEIEEVEDPNEDHSVDFGGGCDPEPNFDEEVDSDAGAGGGAGGAGSGGAGGAGGGSGGAGGAGSGGGGAGSGGAGASGAGSGSGGAGFGAGGAGSGGAGSGGGGASGAGAGSGGGGGAGGGGAAGAGGAGGAGGGGAGGAGAGGAGGAGGGGAGGGAGAGFGGAGFGGAGFGAGGAGGAGAGGGGGGAGAAGAGGAGGAGAAAGAAGASGAAAGSGAGSGASGSGASGAAGGAGAGAGACFSADTTVKTLHGKTKRMDELEIGDWVFSASNGKMGFSRVESWLHRMPEMESDFLKFTFENGKTLKITKKHFIYKIDCFANETIIQFPQKPLLAEQIHLSDCLPSLIYGHLQPLQITQIETIHEKGIYAPLTDSGNIIVNDILASCSSEVDNYLSSFILSTLNSYFKEAAEMFGIYFDSIFKVGQNDIDLVPGIEGLISLAKNVI